MIQDSTLIFISTSWVLFGSVALYFAYKAHCNIIYQRCTNSFITNGTILLESYRKFREQEVKALTLYTTRQHDEARLHEDNSRHKTKS